MNNLSLYEYKETLEKSNNKIVGDYIKRFSNYIITIINLLLFILLADNIIDHKNKIKKLEKLENLEKSLENQIKKLDYKNDLINKQFEAFYIYLYSMNNKSSMYQIIKPKEILGKKKVRIGKESDGGYVLLNDLEKIKFAYSFGISNEISFDKYLADLNIDIFMYDHTIEKLPFTNKKFHWKKIGLTEKKVKFGNMNTFEELIKENGHINEKNMILKMDIEGAEWNIFNELKEELILQFKYILVEFHFKEKYKSIYLDVFKKINKTHQIFHLHCNNLGTLIYYDGYIICSAIEVSFIIKEKETLIKSSDLFPVKNIDFKNNKTAEDFDNLLNFYQIDNIFSK